jgi:hypothetical protein
VGYYFYARQSAYRASRDYNYNYNVNLSDSNSNSDSNDNTADDSNSNSNSSTTTSASSLSDDDKHKLFHAASVTGDTELMHRVQVAIGLLNDDYSPKDEYRQFATAHVAWVFKNMDFIQEVNTPEKAKAYIDEHLL